MGLVQAYNKRSKKWVLIDDEKQGGIQEMRAEKYDGIPVKNEGKNGTVSKTETKEIKPQTKQQPKTGTGSGKEDRAGSASGNDPKDKGGGGRKTKSGLLSFFGNKKGS